MRVVKEALKSIYFAYARARSDEKLRRATVRVPTDWRDIPVVINSRDRLSCLSRMVSWLESVGIRRVVILDNQSTYEPLLSFYEKSRHQIVRLDRNLGFLALWRSSFFRSIAGQYYVYTDPDLLPIAECPRDFLGHFLEVLSRFPTFEKVGFGLRIDDIPYHYAGRQAVIDHEAQFWTREIATGLYEARIDTTFALYRPFKWGGYWLRSLRTAHPYLMRHLPWYASSTDLSDEDVYYQTHGAVRRNTQWTGRFGSGEARGRTLRARS